MRDVETEGDIGGGTKNFHAYNDSVSRGPAGRDASPAGLSRWFHGSGRIVIRSVPVTRHGADPPFGPMNVSPPNAYAVVP